MNIAGSDVAEYVVKNNASRVAFPAIWKAIIAAEAKVPAMTAR